MSVQVGRERAVTSDNAGAFQTDVGVPGTYTAVIRGDAVVERETSVNAPGGDVRLSLIPSVFDLTAFDQLARSTNERLQRWTTQPSLVVIASVMQFLDGIEDGYPAGDQKMTDLEVSRMITHLSEGLSLWTGGTYKDFASTITEHPAAGTAVSVKRPGKIVVGRYDGIVSTTGVIGYGTWLDQADGSVIGGAIFVDRSFDQDDARRRLLRIHELGHALGYQHVTSRPSVMNPMIGPEPTDFDEAAGMIAFQRPPGNRAPDRDPEPTSRIASRSSPGWARPVP
ncbi:MAG: hypothetical protein C5B57_10895 [Blastocatellia bacterium]|nr:MAG: hypothetical protein C5B57_10895 [Blastocatellia bacterium]